MNRLAPYLVLSFLMPLVYISAQCDDDGNYWEESWRSCLKSANPNPDRGDSYWILYEFTEPVGIGEVHIWNANRTGESDSGLKEVFIDVSKDGINWEQVGEEAFEWEKAPETPNYEGFIGPTLSTYGLIEKILITVQSTHGDACASLAEIRFNVDKDACAGQLDACGVCDGPGQVTFYLDADGDGEGNQNIFVQSCEATQTGYVTNNTDTCDTGGWDQVRNIFEANSCTGCHNQGAEGGLDLTSYEGFLNGGNKCGTNIHSGNTLVNIIQIEGYDECGQAIQGLSMNSRVDNQLDGLEIAAIQAWIDAGAPRDSECQDPIGPNPNSTVETTKLYPNPSNGFINIETISENFVEGVDVYDISGHVIYQKYDDGNAINSIDLTHLNHQGVYFVRLIGKFDDGESESFHKILLE